MTDTRRNFLRKTVMAGISAFTLPEIISSAMPVSAAKKIALQKDFVILFQGDSITDAGRNRETSSVNNPGSLGTGYAMLAASRLLENYPSLNLKIYNRGISGNKVFQLAERWEKDCIGLKPDVLSILIGVNDFWHKLNGNYDGTVDKYRKDYTALLERTINALPGVRLVICEPFAVSGVKAVDEKWFPEFTEYRNSAKEIAEKFGAVFVPFQAVYDVAVKRAPASYWTGDGVHASLAGAALMAEAWLRVVK